MAALRKGEKLIDARPRLKCNWQQNIIPITDITILVATIYNKNQLNIFSRFLGKTGFTKKESFEKATTKEGEIVVECIRSSDMPGLYMYQLVMEKGMTSNHHYSYCE